MKVATKSPYYYVLLICRDFLQGTVERVIIK